MAKMFKCALLIVILLGIAPGAMAGQSWQLVIPADVLVSGPQATLADIAGSGMPDAAANLVVHAGAKPNTVITITRQGILRRLVSAGLADGLSISGSRTCRIRFDGTLIDPIALENQVRKVIQPLVPGAKPSAPASWIEIKIPDTAIASSGDWTAVPDRKESLHPGRNLVQVGIQGSGFQERLPVVVTLHYYGQTGSAIGSIARKTPLAASMFNWKWTDLADQKQGVVTGPEDIRGTRATAAIKAGQTLRQAHLEKTPLVLAGDSVELRILRGQVAVSVRALARQPGCLGQTIPVRNELTGRLVNARITGPGLVEWRR